MIRFLRQLGTRTTLRTGPVADRHYRERTVNEMGVSLWLAPTCSSRPRSLFGELKFAYRCDVRLKGLLDNFIRIEGGRRSLHCRLGVALPSKIRGGGVLSVGTRFKRVVREAALAYSKLNRRRKADVILAFLGKENVKDVLLVGATGHEHDDERLMSHEGIVERRIADRYEIKMGINIVPSQITEHPFMIADARDMPFEDDYVDFALANAIIEHVGGEHEQRQMVDEMTRVARCWVITTPNKWFPVESHTHALFLHWLPSWRRKHQREFTRLLSLREFRALLPAGVEVSGWPWSPTFLARYVG